MAVIKDVYSEKESVHMTSKVTFVIALSPAAEPIFGGYIGTFLGWRAYFNIVAVWAYFVFLSLLQVFSETLPASSQQRFSIKKAARDSRILFSCVPFLCYTIIASCTFSALFAYISIAPFY